MNTNNNHMDTNEFPLKEECYQIIGAGMEVANELGCGFLESVYQEALSYEFSDQEIPFVDQKILDVYYKGRLFKKKFMADFICFEEVIVEIKAIDTLRLEHFSQVLNYLKATDKSVGLLVNFGTAKLQYKRIIR